MEKIEINEENYNDYQEFLDAKNSISTMNHPIIMGILISLGSVTFVFGGVGLLVLIMMSIMKVAEVIGMSSILEALAVIAGVGSYIGVVAAMGMIVFPKIVSKHLIKKFQKKHPDFDINLDKKEVEKELEKYRQLSKIPKNIETKKEEHLDRYKNDFGTMTTEEKLSFLEQEREFWEQVAIQEKYSDINEDENELVSSNQKNPLTKPKEKNYHI